MKLLGVLFVVIQRINLFACSSSNTTERPHLWTEWIVNRNELQSRINETKCNKHDCANQLLDQLHEIHQDLVYANKTINVERISSRLSNRLSDIESALEEYSIASKDSNEALDRSIKQISAHYYNITTNETTSDNSTQIGLYDMVDSSITQLELDASRLETGAEAQMIDKTRLTRKQASMLSKLGLLDEQHRRQMELVSVTMNDLLSLAGMNYSKNEVSADYVGGSCNQSCDEVGYNSTHLDNIVEQSNLILNDQLKDGSHIAALESVVLLKTRQLTNLTRLFDDLTHDSRAARLISNRLLQNGHSNSFSLNNKQLDERLTWLLSDSCKRLNDTVNLQDQISKLKQSVIVNDKRRSNEQLLLLKSMKNMTSINLTLDRLSKRLINAQKDGLDLRNGQAKIDLLNHSAKLGLKNETEELTTKNSLVLDWFNQELAVKANEIIKLNEQLTGLAESRSRRVHNWTQIIEFAKTVDLVQDEIHDIDTNLARIDQAMNKANSAPTRETILTILNSVKVRRANEIPKLASRVARLKDQVASSMFEIEQIRNRLNETNYILTNLSRKQVEVREHYAKINSYLANTSSEFTSTITRIDKLKHYVEQLPKEFLPFYQFVKYPHQKQLASLNQVQLKDLTQLPLFTSSFDHKEFSKLTLKPIKANHAKLHDRVMSLFNLAQIRNVTQTASGMQQSIDSLKSKVEKARFLITRINDSIESKTDNV